MNLGRVRGTEAEKMSRNPSCFMAQIFTKNGPSVPIQEGVRGGAPHTARLRSAGESVQYLAPAGGGSTSAFLAGAGEEWGGQGAGDVTPGYLNYVPTTGAPDLLSGAETHKRTKGPGDICDSAAVTLCMEALQFSEPPSLSLYEPLLSYP